jgi:hypothetical protein
LRHSLAVFGGQALQLLGALGREIGNADMTEVDAIFARHGAVTLPPDWIEDFDRGRGLEKRNLQAIWSASHVELRRQTRPPNPSRYRIMGSNSLAGSS